MFQSSAFQPAFQNGRQAGLVSGFQEDALQVGKQQGNVDWWQPGPNTPNVTAFQQEGFQTGKFIPNLPGMQDAFQSEAFQVTPQEIVYPPEPPPTPEPVARVTGAGWYGYVEETQKERALRKEFERKKKRLATEEKRVVAIEAKITDTATPVLQFQWGEASMRVAEFREELRSLAARITEMHAVQEGLKKEAEEEEEAAMLLM